MRALALLSICSLVAFTVVCLTPGCARAQLSPELRELGSELDELDAEIALIQDLNRLQLTREQVQGLIPAVDRLRATALEFEQQRIAILRELEPAMKRMRDVLLRDGHPDEALHQQILQMQQRLAELDVQFEEAAARHATDFREILTEPQLAIVTGEEEARRQVVELLEWARELDDAAFEREVPPYAEELADPEIGLSEDEILDLLGLARAMDAEQYRRSEPELIGRLTDLFVPEDEIADRIIAHAFLHDAMADVLSDKLALMAD